MYLLPNAHNQIKGNTSQVTRYRARIFLLYKDKEIIFNCLSGYEMEHTRFTASHTNQYYF